MIKAPYEPDRDFDRFLSQGMKAIGHHISTKNDDWVLMVAGDPGTGKSTWSLHAVTEYLPPELLKIDVAAFSREDFAKSLKYSSNAPKPRNLWYDEANITKRDAMSKWNKKLLDLYYNIRGLNIFHIWCNPSIEIIDKPFVKERLKGLILIAGHNAQVRFYYYFRKRDVLKILKKYETLDLELLNKVKGAHAYYRGWFKDYNGPLKQAYLDKKENRMKVKVQEFFDDFSGEDSLGLPQMAKRLGVSDTTIRRLIKAKVVVEGEHFSITGGGLYKFKPESLSVLQGHLRTSKKDGEVV